MWGSNEEKEFLWCFWRTMCPVMLQTVITTFILLSFLILFIFLAVSIHLAGPSSGQTLCCQPREPLAFSSGVFNYLAAAKDKLCWGGLAACYPTCALTCFMHVLLNFSSLMKLPLGQKAFFKICYCTEKRPLDPLLICKWLNFGLF